METINIKTFESIIRKQLSSIGYFDIEISDEKKDSFDVVALGKMRKIFLKVLVKLATDRLIELTTAEISGIKRVATENQKEPWAAIMYVDEKGELIDGIKWKDLSKATTA